MLMPRPQQQPAHLGGMVPSLVGTHQASGAAAAASPGACRSSPLLLPLPGSHLSPAGSLPRPPRPSPVMAFPMPQQQQLQQQQPQQQQLWGGASPVQQHFQQQPHQQPLMHAPQYHAGSPALQPLYRGSSPMLQQALPVPGLAMGVPLDSSNSTGATRGGGGLAGPAMDSHLPPRQGPQYALPVVSGSAPMAATGAAGGLPLPFQQHPQLYPPLPMQFIPVPQPRAL
jgi:hypothetical protein